MSTRYVPPLAYRAKEGLRRIVRELILFIVVSGIAAAIILPPAGFGPWPGSYEYATELFLMAAIVGIFGGPLLWALYRVGRFALGR